MSSLFKLFQNLKPAKVLVAGDFFLDTYTIGKAKRISPEAPVAVVNVCEQKVLPGGAGNVVLNLKSLDLETIPFGRIGNDLFGKEILQGFNQEGICTDGLIVDPHHSTPNKMRIISDRQQVVRVDYETITPISKEFEQKALDYLDEVIEQLDCIAISDYAKGFLSDTLVKALLEKANKHKIPVLVDPKGNDFRKYAGCTLIKPNLKEALQASKLSESLPLEEHAKKILEMTHAQHLVITLSDSGIALFNKECERFNFPTKKKEVVDVTGAGDTVLATLVMAIANQFPLDDAMELSNISAGIAVERLGCARVNLADLAHALFTETRANKVFDYEHFDLLKQALDGKSYRLIELDQPFNLDSTQLLKLNQLSQDGALIALLEEEALQPEFIEMLSLLEPIDFIITKDRSLISNS